MATPEEKMTLSYTYQKVKAIFDGSDDTTRTYLQGLADVELFCQQHNDHYYVKDICNIDLNTLHQVALSGLNSLLRDIVVDRLRECVSILEEYSTYVGREV